MAQPSSRRSSGSRRVQYGIFTGYVIAAIGALVGAGLLTFSLLRDDSGTTPSDLTAELIAPIGAGTSSVQSGGQSWIEWMRGYWNAGSKNSALKEEVELARIRLEEVKAIQQENDRLKGLLGLAEGEIKPIAITRLIGSSSSSSRRFGYLGVGQKDGIKVGMSVRSSRGVVGRILKAGYSTSRVLFLSDTQSVLPVRLADPDRVVIAFVEGRGDPVLRVRLINLGLNPLKKGDVLVTSGAGGYYHPGIAVAIVTETTDDGALARMVSDPAATSYVTVEPIWQPETVKATDPDTEMLSGNEDDSDSDDGSEGGDQAASNNSAANRPAANASSGSTSSASSAPNSNAPNSNRGNDAPNRPSASNSNSNAGTAANSAPAQNNSSNNNAGSGAESAVPMATPSAGGAASTAAQNTEPGQ